MGKSKQFAQLLELRKKEIVLKVICKQPKKEVIMPISSELDGLCGYSVMTYISAF